MPEPDHILKPQTQNIIEDLFKRAAPSVKTVAEQAVQAAHDYFHDTGKIQNAIRQAICREIPKDSPPCA